MVVCYAQVLLSALKAVDRHSSCTKMYLCSLGKTVPTCVRFFLGGVQTVWLFVLVVVLHLEISFVVM